MNTSFDSSLDIQLHDINRISLKNFKDFLKEQKNSLENLKAFDENILCMDKDIKLAQNEINYFKIELNKSIMDTNDLKQKMLKIFNLVELTAYTNDAKILTFQKHDFEYYNELIKDYNLQIKNMNNILMEVKMFIESFNLYYNMTNKKMLIQSSKFIKELIVTVASNLQTTHEITQHIKKEFISK